jgi:PPOX class probable F420-dependent enzyme
MDRTDGVDGLDGVEGWVAGAIGDARVGRLGTVDSAGAVRLVPICFAVVDGCIVGAVDHKPKRTGQLRRLQDITATGTATVLLDHYAENWTQLWWVRIRGRAVVHDAADVVADHARAALVAKYPQYRQAPPAGSVYSIAMDEVRWWRWSD